jgi:hypothetical protein
MLAYRRDIVILAADSAFMGLLHGIPLMHCLLIYTDLYRAEFSDSTLLQH